MDEHGRTKDAEKDIGAPLDIDEGGGDEVAKGEIESPIGRRGERDGFAADAQRIELRWIDPRDRTPGRSEGSDEEVREGDDGFGGRAGDGIGRSGRVVDAVGSGIVAVADEDAAVGEEPGHHEGGADEEGGTTAPAVDVEEGRHGHDDVDDVLDRGGHEQVVSRETGHGEDVGDVVLRLGGSGVSKVEAGKDEGEGAKGFLSPS